MLLHGKKALITGGTSGIGLAIAKTFLREGAQVVLWGRNQTKGDAASQELKQMVPNGEVTFQSVDVSNLQMVTEAFTQLSDIQIVVNCAGVTRDGLFMKMSEEDWDTVLDCNLKSCFNVCKQVIRPMMKARAGRIINVSSVIGLTGNPGQVNYSASKAGMIGMTRSLAKEVASRGVTVNCIAPGFFQTEMTDVLSDGIKQELMRKIPMGRMGEVEEVANVALFLASDLSSYITGQTITVDGGMLA